MDKKVLYSSILWVVTAGGQIIAALILYNPEASSARINLGWLIILLAAIFGWLPIFTLRGRGEVEGPSYIHTTVLVDNGIYAVIRHPQYLAGLLINLAAPLITWHWLVVLLGLLSIGMYVWSADIEEKKNLEKFGAAYQDYINRVPRFNVLLGFYRILTNTNPQESE